MQQEATEIHNLARTTHLQQVAVVFENSKDEVANLTLRASVDGIVQEMNSPI